MAEIKTLVFGAAGVWATWKIGRAVKNKICQWNENRVRRQYEARLAALTENPDLYKKEQGKVSATSTRLESTETEPDFTNTSLEMMASDFELFEPREDFLERKFKQERIKRRLEQEEHQEEIAALKSQVESTTFLAHKIETTLLRKLSQEEAFQEELVSRWKEKTRELENTLNLLVYQNENLQEQLQSSEKWDQSARVEHEELKEQIAALKSQVERNSILAQEKETTLLRKLIQEEVLRQELVSKCEEKIVKFENMMNLLKDEYEKLREQAQRTEKSEYSARVKNEELKEQIAAHKSQMERSRILAQEKETTLLRKIAEEEAKTAQANAKFAEYEKEMARFNREQQNYRREKALREAQESLFSSH